MMTQMDGRGRGALHRYAMLTAIATFLLLIAGGLVTSTDSGLSVPDWPLSYGGVFPPMVGGIAFEHTHRMIAAVVGLLIAGLAGWLWRAEPRRWVRRLGYAALGAVLTQAVLGGLTVLLVLPPSISVAHACLGQTVFCLTVILALVTSPSWSAFHADDPAAKARLRGPCLLMTLLLGFQLFLGAVIRHSGQAVGAHVMGACILIAMAGHILRMARHEAQRLPWLRRLVGMMAAAVAGQILLGIATLASHQHVVIATAHVALGALILAGSCVLTALVFRGAGVLPLAPLEQGREVRV